MFENLEKPSCLPWVVIASLMVMALLSGFSVDAQDAARVRVQKSTEKIKNGTRTVEGFGTCFEFKGWIVSTGHTFGEYYKDKKSKKLAFRPVYERIEIETVDGWVDAELVHANADFDVAFLKLSKPAKLPTVVGDGLFSSVAKAPIAQLVCVGGRFEGFEHGGSGSPLYRAGQLEAMAIAFEKGNSSSVVFVSASIIEAIKP